MKNKEYNSHLRRQFVLICFALGAILLLARAVDLQILQKDFLQTEGDARHLRVVSLWAHRGTIMDRNAEPIAMSTPVDSVWANPRETLHVERQRLDMLARVLGIPEEDLYQRMASRAEREFVYLRRHVNPLIAQQVRDLRIPGVALQREYRRYYPMGETSAHILGFTNIDDRGQEGIELAYDDWLAGIPGAKRVLRDRLGRVIRDVENIRPAQPGRDLMLTIDQRLQYVAYRELKTAVQAHNALAGTAVILDARNGDVLAMVNQPSYNPNNRTSLRGDASRNRAVTDLFEPGSIVKPLAVAGALDSGRINPNIRIDTSPGQVRVGGFTIRDVRNFGTVDLSTLIIKSSNVAMVKLSQQMEPSTLWTVYHRAGFGRLTGIGFPGEATGVLRDFILWRASERATMSFGYGLSVTALQLAQSYLSIATDGVTYTPRLVYSHDARYSERVMQPETAKAMRLMLEGAVSREGTGPRARVEGYRVAGKTGTVRKSTAGGYAKDRYLALFAGLAPVSDPRLVMVIMIDEPRTGEFYGGLVAAPVFSRVMHDALRLLNIAPDDQKVLEAAQARPRGGA